MARKSLFRDLDTRCGGTGWLECSCGGDQCYCALNGGIDCSGCPDCEGPETDDDDYGPDDDDLCENCQRAPVADGFIGNSGLCRACYCQLNDIEEPQ